MGISENCTVSFSLASAVPMLQQGGGGGGPLLPYKGYIGMCCCEGYCFKVLYSGIGYTIRELGSRMGYHFSGN